MTLGDSKTADGTWQPVLVSNIRRDAGVSFLVLNGGIGGATVATAASGIATILAGLNPPDAAGDVLCNWGVNEMSNLPTQATWTANYLTIIDAVTTKWPGARVWIAYPWKQGQNVAAATLHGWIDAVIAARPGVAFAGLDEAAWFAPNVATYSTDGVHWSQTTAGAAAGADAWQTAMGY